jgi:hypothetical protein
VTAPTGAADLYHDKLVTIFSAHDNSIDVADSDVIWQAQWRPPVGCPLDAVLPPAQKTTPAMIVSDTVGGHITVSLG